MSEGLKLCGFNPAPLSRSSSSPRQLDLLSATVREIEDQIRDCQGVVIATGTTAFPSAKWKGGNNPRAIDLEATLRILEAVKRVNEGRDEDPTRIKKVLLLTSIGTSRASSFPFVILNLFGVLDAKREAEVRRGETISMPITLRLWR